MSVTELSLETGSAERIPPVGLRSTFACLHDWRRSPSNAYRLDSDGHKMQMLRCANCDARGWGLENTDPTTWPKWNGDVIED